MNWLPTHGDLRAAVKAAAEATTPAARRTAILDLARYRSSFLETIQLDNLARKSSAELAAVLPTVRLAILSTTTMDHVWPSIRVAALRRRLWIDGYHGAYGQIRQELLDERSGLHAHRPEVVLFSLDYREVVSRVQLNQSEAEVEAALGRLCDEVASLWASARERFACTVIQQNVLDVSEPLFGSLDRLVPGSPSGAIWRFNELLARAVARERVLLLDVVRASERRGMDVWFDRVRWLQGKILIAPAMAPMYGELVARLVAAARGLSKKCLVLDLDNTLWGGVIGDDGLEGIKLGEGSGVGEAHLAVQRYARMLKERGVILAVCSKNDPAIAARPFDEHPEMVLRRSDIAAFVANWNDKAENLKRVAETLNIGIDSLVFLDDNPVERARIREALPEVSVPDLPDDPAEFVQRLADAGYFEAVSFTAEDQERGAQYAANSEREALRETAKSMDDFLRDLGMTMTHGAARPVDLARVTQLLNKTNQFNTTTRRFTPEEVARLATEETVLQFRLIDRFGDNGLVSVMILTASPDRADTVVLDNWVMSCRVFGRQLEDEALNAMVVAAQAQGAKTVVARFVPTPKNAVVADLFQRLGFDCIERSEDGSSRWSLDLDAYAPRSTFIRTEGQT
jgi:FkbH-like protein